MQPNPLRESHAAADALARERDSVFKVGLLQALASDLAATGGPVPQGIAALRHRLAICTQPVPTGLSLDSGAALAEAGSAAERWLQPWPQPALDLNPPAPTGSAPLCLDQPANSRVEGAAGLAAGRRAGAR